MELGIDFTNKVVTIFNDVNLRELFDTLKELNIDKDEWTLEPYADEKIVKEYIYVPTYKQLDWVQPYQPSIQPWTLPQIWCDAAGIPSMTYTQTDGTGVTLTMSNKNSSFNIREQ